MGELVVLKHALSVISHHHNQCVVVEIVFLQMVYQLTQAFVCVCNFAFVRSVGIFY